MSAAFFAVLAAFLASIGGRDQMLIAEMTSRGGRRATLLLTGMLSCAGASAIAGVLAREAGDLGHVFRLLVAALGLALAGIESLIRKPRARMVEPTRSLGAAAVVLFADQLADPARFLVVALGVQSLQPLASASGGWLGSALALGIGAWHGRWLLRRQGLMTTGRRLAGALLLVAAIAVVLWVRLVVAP